MFLVRIEFNWFFVWFSVWLVEFSCDYIGYFFRMEIFFVGWYFFENDFFWFYFVFSKFDINVGYFVVFEKVL